MIVLAFLSLFLLGQLGRVTFFHQEVALYAYELIALPLTVIILLRDGSYRKVPPFVLWFLASFWITFLLSLARFTVIQNLIAFLYLVRLSLYSCALFLLPNMKSAQAQLKQSSWIMHILALGLIIPGVLQYVFMPDLRNLFYLGWDPHAYRVFGQFFEPAVAAALYGIGGMLFLVQKLPLRPLTRYTYAITLLVLGVMTFSRGYFIALFVTLLITAFRSSPLRKVTIVIVALLILVFTIVPKPFGEGVNILRTSTVESRLKDYQRAMLNIQQNPLFGVGYNHIRYVKGTEDSVIVGESHSGASFHSTFLIVMATTGAIGLALYLWYLYQSAQLSNVMANIIVFSVVFSLFDNILFHPFVLMAIVIGRTMELTFRRRR